MFRFYTPLKHQKTIGFSMYSGGGGGRETKHWPEMGYH